MLRIKDNVDLKELKKYGFKYNKKYKYLEYGNDEYDVTIYLYIDDRLLQCCTPDDYDLLDSTSHLNALYDLIKADLVEKVEDKE